MGYSENIKAQIGLNDLGYDAWGRPKVISDNSIFHGMFTFNVPVTTWHESLNGADVVFTNATSLDGALKVVSGAGLNDIVNLKTYRNPRYEPNRGFLYSTAGFLDVPGAAQNRSFGVATAESGVFFRLASGTLEGVVRTTVGGSTTEAIIPLTIPAGVDLAKGNVYDIQYQWRGVGNYKFFLNLEEVGNSNYLGTLTNLSMFNPANPLFFESQNLGDNEPMRFGCVDVTSEGGKNNGKTYGSAGITNDTGEVNFIGYNQPIIAIRSKLTVGTYINTRDTIALLASAYGDEKCLFRVWATRDFSAITPGNSSWEDHGDGHLEVIEMLETAGTMSFDTAKVPDKKPTFTCRVAKENTYATAALFEGRTDIYITPGDMFVFTLHRETGTATKGGVTFEFGEEI